MPNWNGVNWDEKSPESGNFSMDPAGVSRCTRKIWIDWSAAKDAAKAFLGYAQLAVWPASGVKYIERFNPWPHPDWEDFFYAESFANVEGFLPDRPAISPTLTPQFEEWMTTINLRSWPNGYQFREDVDVVDPDMTKPGTNTPSEYLCLRNMEFNIKGNAKAQTIPGASGLRWPDGRAVSAAAFVTLHDADIVIDWYPVPTACFNRAAFDALVGKSNANPFGHPNSLLGVRAAGTLTMGKVTETPIRMGDTEWAYKVRIPMKEHPGGANFFWRWNAAGGGAYQLVSRAGGAVLYPPADFNAAFIPP